MSNPLGQDTINISVNVPVSLYNGIKDLATRNQMKMGPYVRLLLLDAQKRKVQMDVNISQRTIENFMLNEKPDHPTTPAVPSAETDTSYHKRKKRRK